MHGSYLAFLFMYSKLPQILFINSCLEFSIIFFPQCFSFYGHLFLAIFCPKAHQLSPQLNEIPSSGSKENVLIFCLFVELDRSHPSKGETFAYELGLGMLHASSPQISVYSDFEMQENKQVIEFGDLAIVTNIKTAPKCFITELILENFLFNS